ncbi:hypothetical protein GHT06_020318 [Daphnia sinensis]|uniref:Uncharacterized protein n=1 Tax=Daphnia sinensis TaxID=1820382 RepID=A0AAD5KLX8_9CRUS|nr:hypothetical protein GHT06_020318 [Daphnia sinensis]
MVGSWMYTVKKLHHYIGVMCPKSSANEIWGSQPQKLCIVSQYEIFGGYYPWLFVQIFCNTNYEIFFAHQGNDNPINKMVQEIT